MARYRQIPTSIRSERDIERALTEMGLKHVEVHDPPQPLTDWIGRPTTVFAQVIVRRKDLGASSDDLGFVRNQDGTFDMLVSEIHLFRFDKKWMAELAQRTGTVMSERSSITIASSTVKPAPKPPTLSGATLRPGTPPTISAAPSGRPQTGTQPESNAAQHARLESAVLLDRARKSQSLGTIGCLLYFVPLLPTLLVALASNRGSAAGGLIVLWIVWTMVYFFVVALVLSVRFQRRAREFAQRFSAGGEARTAAIAHLRSVAIDQKNAGSKTAERLLKQIDASAVSAITRHLPKQPRGPGGTRP